MHTIIDIMRRYNNFFSSSDTTLQYVLALIKRTHCYFLRNMVSTVVLSAYITHKAPPTKKVFTECSFGSSYLMKNTCSEVKLWKEFLGTYSYKPSNKLKKIL